jgi:hypothetical protein
MAFLAYIDASGSGLDPNIRAISVGGFVAHEDVWAEFERRWRDVLQRFAITALHMKDYAHSKGEFAGWRDDSDRRVAFTVAIADVIRSSGLQAFGASMPVTSNAGRTYASAASSSCFKCAASRMARTL